MSGPTYVASDYQDCRWRTIRSEVLAGYMAFGKYRKS